VEAARASTGQVSRVALIGLLREFSAVISLINGRADARNSFSSV
jgi:hypothetical protein